MGSRHCFREQPTFRYPHVLRRTFGRFLCYSRRVQTVCTRTHHRHFKRRLREKGISHGFADARTAHQTRKSHFKHLYGTSPTGNDVVVLCRVSWTRRIEKDCRTCPFHCFADSRRTGGNGIQTTQLELFRYPQNRTSLDYFTKRHSKQRRNQKYQSTLFQIGRNRYQYRRNNQ